MNFAQASPRGPATTFPQGRLPWRWLAALAAVASVGLGLILLLQWWASDERVAMSLLRSDKPEAQQQGAWIAADGSAPTAIQEIARRLQRAVVGGKVVARAGDTREDPAAKPIALSQVRESFVYALGRAGTTAHLDLVVQVLRTDPDAYVRAAAWLAAARLAPGQLESLLVEPQLHDEPWDRLGRAIARLEAGQTDTVDELLGWAIDGDAEQRHAASQALYRRLMPLLDSIGRWPLEYEVRDGEAWPEELVREVRERCRRIDLAAVAAEVNELRSTAAPTRRLIGRLYSTRDRLERVLLWR